MKVLVTGGAGYIGSHTVVELLGQGRDVAIVDNFSNSSPEVLRRIEALSGRQPLLLEADARSKEDINEAFTTFKPEAVIHFAGLKAVGESVEKPLLYYENNVVSTINVCEAAVKTGVKKVIFSSTATVYGEPSIVPVPEDAPLDPQSPYARTKIMCEEILRDTVHANPSLSAVILRYFNPIGAHPSGQMGENPLGVPNNLLPFVAQVAVGRRDELKVFGDDYDTPDGTGVRDYLHVCDLAEGHVAALEHDPSAGVATYNLGTGKGQSVLEVIRAFEKASGVKIPYKVVKRRAGDVASYYADPSRAEKELGWKAKRTLDDMCADTWKWQSMNPSGY